MKKIKEEREEMEQQKGAAVAKAVEEAQNAAQNQLLHMQQDFQRQMQEAKEKMQQAKKQVLQIRQNKKLSVQIGKEKWQLQR